MLIVTARELEQALPMPAAVEAVEAGFRALAEGRVEQPLRSATEGAGGTMLAMPARVRGIGLGLKVVSVFSGNADRGMPTINGAVLLLDEETGRPQALLEGRTLTAIRTGAASGVATRYLAAPQARVLAIFGAGAQAPWQVEAVCAVRPIEQVLIVNRDQRRGEELRERLLQRSPAVPADIRLTTAQAAVGQADVICCATSADRPLFDDAGLRAGVHINAVGAYTSEMREVPSATVARAYVVVDQREACWAEAGDLIIPRDEGLIDESHVAAELGEIISGAARGRTDSEQVTLFKSVGLGLQDIAAARAAYEHAIAAGIGTSVEW